MTSFSSFELCYDWKPLKRKYSYSSLCLHQLFPCCILIKGFGWCFLFCLISFISCSSWPSSWSDNRNNIETSSPVKEKGSSFSLHSVFTQGLQGTQIRMAWMKGKYLSQGQDRDEDWDERPVDIERNSCRETTTGAEIFIFILFIILIIMKRSREGDDDDWQSVFSCLEEQREYLSRETLEEKRRETTSLSVTKES